MDVDVIGADAVGAEIQNVGLQMPVRAAAVQHTTADLLRTAISSTVPYAGTPPYVYRESWEVENDTEEQGVVLFTTTPYAERLERGFERMDRLGRQQQQSANPTVDPAVEAIEEHHEEAMAAGTLPLL